MEVSLVFRGGERKIDSNGTSSLPLPRACALAPDVAFYLALALLPKGACLIDMSYTYKQEFISPLGLVASMYGSYRQHGMEHGRWPRPLP